VKGKEANGVGSQAGFNLTRNSPSSVTTIVLARPAIQESQYSTELTPPPIYMDSSVSLEDRIWFLRVCHHVPFALYQEILALLSDAVCRKRPEFWENQTSILHQDNSTVHASRLIRIYPAKHQASVVSHPPYSPGLPTAEFSCFKILKPL